MKFYSRGATPSRCYLTPITSRGWLVAEYSGTDEDAAVEAGVFNVTSRCGQKLPTTQPNPYVAPEIRVPLKILSNANVAPRWIDPGPLADREINNLRQRVIQHEHRMAQRYSRCTNGRASDFPEGCKEHNLHRLDLETHIASAQHSVNSFNAIAPEGVRRKGFIGSPLLKTLDRAWPWHALTPFNNSE